MQSIMLDTSLFAGQNGFLDFQFNPAAAGAPAAAVAVENFSTDGVLGGNYLRTGAVAGTIASASSPLTIRNFTNPPANEDAEHFLFGKGLSLLADFSGTAIANPDPSNPLESSFTIAFYGMGGNTLYSRSYTITPSGSVITTATPEPAAEVLLLTGLAFLSFLRIKGRI